MLLAFGTPSVMFAVSGISLLLLILTTFCEFSAAFYYSKLWLTSDLFSFPRFKPLMGSVTQLKGARKYTRNRPKKTTPAEIYPSPTLYYGNIQDYFGSPPEYLAIPVHGTLEILRQGHLKELISLMKNGITGRELSQKFSDSSFYDGLSHEIEALRSIAKEQSCDVTSDLVLYFERVLDSPEKHENFVDRLFTLKRLQKYWELREQNRYNRLLKRTFWRLRQVAFKMRDSGVPLEDFVTPELWHRYEVFKGLPRSSMADNYLKKHKVALETDVKNLYYRNETSGAIQSLFDNLGNATSPNCSRVEGLTQPVVDRMAGDLQELGVIDKTDFFMMNMSRIDELQDDFESEDAQKAYAIRDFYLSWRYENYTVQRCPYELEAFVDHEYRTKTLERDLLKKYKGWLLSGAVQKYPKPTGEKYKYLAIWHGLSKNKRRKLTREHIKSLKSEQSVHHDATSA